MSPSIGYFLLAALGLSFLVFIHELGHYLMARRVGMRVEIFSIGFGKPIYVWNHKGVKWQICMLLFGGYVKIAGMDTEKGKDPHDVENGFYSKQPWKRILVALMGPIVNIVFALFLFSMIFFMGGRMKPFEEFTSIIGWVDPSSELSEKGIASGDTITEYNGRQFTGFRDLIYNGVLRGDHTEISGQKIDYISGESKPYHYDLVPYAMPGMPKDIKTIGVLNPASMMIFHGLDEKDGARSPVKDSGIKEGDQVVWANGELIFSPVQLSNIINQNSAYLTISRGEDIIHVRSPRTLIGDLQVEQSVRDEFGDWRRHLGLQETVESQYFLPYEIDDSGVVLRPLGFIDSDLNDDIRTASHYVEGLDGPLLRGDRILAVDGEPVNNSIGIFKKVRSNSVLLMVQSAVVPRTPMTWKDQDTMFKSETSWSSIGALQANIGVAGAKDSDGNVRLLNPVTPVTYKEFLEGNLIMSTGAKERVLSVNPQLSQKEYIFVGATMQSQLVQYNPEPLAVFGDVVLETWRTLSSLFTGSLSPKWLSGPVGIVKLMHDGFSVGIKEAMYWIAMISLNLGLVNLLPIPVLDGGHICFSIWEAITRKRISSKAMERMILPFFVLLIMLFVYITFQDVSRLVG